MVRFTLGEYVKNIWYNAVTILILAATFIVCTIFLSNIIAQTRTYNFMKPYLNDRSLIICRLEDFDINTLTKVDKVLMTNEKACYSNDVKGLYSCVVYNEYAMENLTPRLAEGRQIDEVKADNNTMKILISENRKGLGAGDTVTLNFYSGLSVIETEAVITGVISEGQKIFAQSGYIKADMSAEELYLTYSYEQQQYPVVITTEEELNKLDSDISGMNWNCIIKFKDDITEKERQDNYNKILDYEMDKHGYTFSSEIPDSGKLCYITETNLKQTMLKYIPLTVAVFVLIIVCIIGIVSIKTANSMRYYGTLYICGMPYNRAVMMTGAEMMINSALSVIMAVSLIIIQNKLRIVGTINCEIDTLQIIVIVSMCIITTLVSMMMTGIILKQKTPAEILTDTTY